MVESVDMGALGLGMIVTAARDLNVKAGDRMIVTPDGLVLSIFTGVLPGKPAATLEGRAIQAVESLNIKEVKRGKRRSNKRPINPDWPVERINEEALRLIERRGPINAKEIAFILGFGPRDRWRLSAALRRLRSDKKIVLAFETSAKTQYQYKTAPTHITETEPKPESEPKPKRLLNWRGPERARFQPDGTINLQPQERLIYNLLRERGPMVKSDFDKSLSMASISSRLTMLCRLKVILRSGEGRGGRGGLYAINPDVAVTPAAPDAPLAPNAPLAPDAAA